MASPTRSAKWSGPHSLRQYTRAEILRAGQCRLPRAEPALPPERVLDLIRQDPTYPMRAAGYDPDPWQAALVRAADRQLAALCTRRAGKTLAVACRVAARVLARRTQVLLFAPTEEQSKELLQYVREMNDAAGCPVPLVRESQTEIAWANGSRVRAKTDRPRSSRGFTPDVIVIDEAACVSDVLWYSVLPMQALGTCELVVPSTPYGRRGWFFSLWERAAAGGSLDVPGMAAGWRGFRVTADECPRIDRATLEAHRAGGMPARWFAQEYYCEFNDAVDAVFPRYLIDAAATDDPRFAPLDLGV